MSIFRRLKNLWEWSKFSPNSSPLNGMEFIGQTQGVPGQTQFIESVSFKEKFLSSTSVDDLLDY